MGESKCRCTAADVGLLRSGAANVQPTPNTDRNLQRRRTDQETQIIHLILLPTLRYPADKYGWIQSESSDFYGLG